MRFKQHAIRRTRTHSMEYYDFLFQKWTTYINASTLSSDESYLDKILEELTKAYPQNELTVVTFSLRQRENNSIEEWLSK